MPHPYLIRPDERRSATPSGPRTVGMAVFVAGRRYFFPGGTVPLARTLALSILGSQLDATDTRIEFGEFARGGWVPSEIVRAGNAPDNRWLR